MFNGKVIHFGRFDERHCGINGTHRFSTDENEVTCSNCKAKDGLVITDSGKQMLRDLGYEVL